MKTQKFPAIITLMALSLGSVNSHAQVRSPKIERKERKLYVGVNSTEAILEYSATFESNTRHAPDASEATDLAVEHSDYMIGPMSYTAITAVPKGDAIISKVTISKNSPYVITYTYKGTVVVMGNNLKDSTYNIQLPINIKKIYKNSFGGTDVSPCTDEHYQSEGDFWYFWSPERPGCSLKEGKDYQNIKAKMKRIPNTKGSSYPEYHNLADKNGKITIHVLFGLDDPNESRNALKSSDVNATNYRDFRSYLLKKGYKATVWKKAQIDKIAKSMNGPAPFVETLSNGPVEYRFFFGPTGIDEESLAFHWFYKDAIENASIMLYGGHSGLGGHLDLDSIEANLGEPIKFNKSRYQIFFFDSCTSYKYYNDKYFARKVSATDKKGTKKLDIFANGLATYFHTMPDSNAALATAIDKAVENATTGKGFVSYQTLAGQIDSNNLFGINGDEDNDKPKAFKLK